MHDVNTNSTPTARCWGNGVWKMAFGFKRLRLPKAVQTGGLAASIQAPGGVAPYGFTASAIQVYLTRAYGPKRAFLPIEEVEARAEHAWDHIQSPQYVEEVGKRTASLIRNNQQRIDAEQQRRLRVKEQS